VDQSVKRYDNSLKGLIHFSHLSTKIGLEIKAVRPEGVFLFPNFSTQMALKNEYSLDFLVLLYQNKRTRAIFKGKCYSQIVNWTLNKKVKFEIVQFIFSTICNIDPLFFCSNLVQSENKFLCPIKQLPFGRSTY
jgi:hypothetical protein